MLANLSAGLFADPGTGKTASTLDFINQYWWKAKNNPRVLVVAPLRVCYSVWPREIAKWENLQHLKWIILHGKGKEEKAKRDGFDVYLINAENIFWLLEDEELVSRFDVLVIDESSKFKNSSSKRFKALRKKLKHFDRRVILTGTPSPKSVEDLWSQIYVLDNGAALGKSKSAFRAAYGHTDTFRGFHEWTPHPGALTTIYKRIAGSILRISAEDHLDLPPLVENDVLVDLPPSALKIYNDAERELFAEIEGVPMLIPSRSVAYGKCRQIAGGYLYAPQGPVAIHSEKLEAVKELVGELQGKPVLVLYHYRHELAALRGAFPTAPIIGSGVTAQESDRIAEHWNRGAFPLLFGHPQSMGHGLNLQGGGNDMIWFTLTDSLEDYLQTVRRLYRQGVVGQVRVHRLIASGTVDEAVRDRLVEKEGTQKSLLDFLAQYKDAKKGVSGADMAADPGRR